MNLAGSSNTNAVTAHNLQLRNTSGSQPRVPKPPIQAAKLLSSQQSPVKSSISSAMHDRTSPSAIIHHALPPVGKTSIEQRKERTRDIRLPDIKPAMPLMQAKMLPRNLDPETQKTALPIRQHHIISSSSSRYENRQSIQPIRLNCNSSALGSRSITPSTRPLPVNPRSWNSGPIGQLLYTRAIPQKLASRNISHPSGGQIGSSFSPRANFSSPSTSMPGGTMQQINRLPAVNMASKLPLPQERGGHLSGFQPFGSSAKNLMSPAGMHPVPFRTQNGHVPNQGPHIPLRSPAGAMRPQKNLFSSGLGGSPALRRITPQAYPKSAPTHHASDQREAPITKPPADHLPKHTEENTKEDHAREPADKHLVDHPEPDRPKPNHTDPDSKDHQQIHDQDHQGHKETSQDPDQDIDELMQERINEIPYSDDPYQSNYLTGIASEAEILYPDPDSPNPDSPDLQYIDPNHEEPDDPAQGRIDESSQKITDPYQLNDLSGVAFEAELNLEPDTEAKASFGSWDNLEPSHSISEEDTNLVIDDANGDWGAAIDEDMESRTHDHDDNYSRANLEEDSQDHQNYGTVDSDSGTHQPFAIRYPDTNFDETELFNSQQDTSASPNLDEDTDSSHNIQADELADSPFGDNDDAVDDHIEEFGSNGLDDRTSMDLEDITSHYEDEYNDTDTSSVEDFHPQDQFDDNRFDEVTDNRHDDFELSSHCDHEAEQNHDEQDDNHIWNNSDEEGVSEVHTGVDCEGTAGDSIDDEFDTNDNDQDELLDDTQHDADPDTLDDYGDYEHDFDQATGDDDDQSYADEVDNDQMEELENQDMDMYMDNQTEDQDAEPVEDYEHHDTDDQLGGFDDFVDEDNGYEHVDEHAKTDDYMAENLNMDEANNGQDDFDDFAGGDVDYSYGNEQDTGYDHGDQQDMSYGDQGIEYGEEIGGNQCDGGEFT